MLFFVVAVHPDKTTRNSVMCVFVVMLLCCFPLCVRCLFLILKAEQLSSRIIIITSSGGRGFVKNVNIQKLPGTVCSGAVVAVWLLLWLRRSFPWDGSGGHPRVAVPCAAYQVRINECGAPALLQGRHGARDSSPLRAAATLFSSRQIA